MPTKFQRMLNRKIAKPINRRTNKTIKQITKATNNTANQIEDVGNDIGNRFNKTANVLIHGRKGFPPQVERFLNKHNEDLIKSITIVRTPIHKAIKSILNIFGNAKSFDKLFHLRIQINTNTTNFTIEKNEVTKVSKWRRDNADETMIKPNSFNNISVGDFIENGIESMGNKKFFNYSTNNNCQSFINGLLKANGINDNSILSFVKQNTASIFKKHPNLRKVSNSLTDFAGKIIDPILQGGTIKKQNQQNPWLDFVKVFKNKHNVTYKEALIGASKIYNK